MYAFASVYDFHFQNALLYLFNSNLIGYINFLHRLAAHDCINIFIFLIRFIIFFDRNNDAYLTVLVIKFYGILQQVKENEVETIPVGRHC